MVSSAFYVICFITTSLLRCA